MANFHTKSADRTNFTNFCSLVRRHPQTVILPVSTTWFQRGLDLFANRPDKEWSLTDCISFEMMADLGLTHALTADHHYLQAGFAIEFP